MDYMPIIISIIALLFSFYQFLNKTSKSDTTQMTTVIVKLEAIGEGITELKEDVKNVRADLLELRERIAIVEQRAKSNTNRINSLDHRSEG